MTNAIAIAISALEVFLNDMRYINPRFTYLLTYLLYLLNAVLLPLRQLRYNG